MRDRYNRAKFSSIIWNFIPPFVKVLLTAILLIAAIVVSALSHVFSQVIWYLLLLFLFMIHCEIYQKKISHRRYVTVNGILGLLLVLVIGSQFYTMKKYGSWDSISAFSAAICISRGTEDIVFSGMQGGTECYLGASSLTERDLLAYFGEKEQKRLHIVEKTYDKAKYVYEGDIYVAKYILDNRDGYHIIKYYKE